MCEIENDNTYTMIKENGISWCFSILLVHEPTNEMDVATQHYCRMLFGCKIVMEVTKRELRGSDSDISASTRMKIIVTLKGYASLSIKSL